jgi:AcrR family transcriptional regulator
MPRKPDPALEARILSAARRLWIKGGDEALSMRAVARAAGTNTPAIYRRFPHRTDILRALVRNIQLDLYQALKNCKSPEEAGERAFKFAMRHQREYLLVTSGLLSRLNEPQPNFDFMKQRCAEWFGGSPDDYGRLVLAMWAAVHGTAMLLISRSAPKGTQSEMPSVLTTIVKVLVQNQSKIIAKA